MTNKCIFYDVCSRLKIVYDEASTVALSAGQRGEIYLNIHCVYLLCCLFVNCRATFSEVFLDISLPRLFGCTFLLSVHPQALCLCMCCSVQLVCDGDIFKETGSRKFQSLTFMKTDACVTFLLFHTIIAIGHPNDDYTGWSQKQHEYDLSKS